MTRYLGKRVALAVPILIGVSLIVFITVKLTPGDPVANLLRPGSSEADRAALVALYGLDQPLPFQYVVWLGNFVRGQWGESIGQQTEVAPLVLRAFKNTLILSAFAGILGLLLGTALGAVSALSRSRFLSRVASGITLASMSAPDYSLAIILLAVFAVQLRWFPAGGMHSIGQEDSLPDLFRHLILPGITAAIVPAGIVARVLRASLLDIKAQPWVGSLRAQGLSEARVRVHILHNALPSLMTISGLELGYLLGGVVFVEVLFSWPGIGYVIYQSISQRDLPVIQAAVLLASAAFVLLNVAVDTLHAAIDPRVREA